MSGGVVISKVKEWITPGLLVIIWYLVQQQFNEMNAKLDLVYPMTADIAVLKSQEIVHAQEIQNNKNALADMSNKWIDLYFKKEEEMTVNKRK